MLKSGLAAVVALLLVGCQTADLPIKDITFASDNPMALLMQHRDSWDPIYERVDLATGQTLGGGLSESPSTGMFDPDPKRTTPALKQELGIEDIKFGSNKGGYAGYLMRPGDYALVGIVQPNTNGVGSWVDVRCFTGKAAVFHLAAGKVSMLEAADRKNTRAEKGDGYDPAVTGKDEKLAKFLVSGYPGVTADVQLAPVVAKIQFTVGTMPQSPYHPCPHGSAFRPAP